MPACSWRSCAGSRISPGSPGESVRIYVMSVIRPRTLAVHVDIQSVDIAPENRTRLNVTLERHRPDTGTKVEKSFFADTKPLGQILDSDARGLRSATGSDGVVVTDNSRTLAHLCVRKRCGQADDADIRIDSGRNVPHAAHNHL